jgi:hypothetical protein
MGQVTCLLDHHTFGAIATFLNKRKLWPGRRERFSPSACRPAGRDGLHVLALAHRNRPVHFVDDVVGVVPFIV